MKRLRPKLMTDVAVLASLAPILWEFGIGSDVMKPIAAPIVGGIITSAIFILVPVFFVIMKASVQKRHAEIDRGIKGLDDPQRSKEKLRFAFLSVKGGPNYGQQQPCSCTGGHFNDPNEQKTQQSPGRGRNTEWHPTHSWKNRHESRAISSNVACPQCGHVSMDSRMAAAVAITSCLRHEGSKESPRPLSPLQGRRGLSCPSRI